MSYICHKNGEKVATKFFCESCDYITSKRSDYDKHILTAKHKKKQLLLKNEKKLSQKYLCEPCDYNTSNKTNYYKHILTAKHKKQENLSNVAKLDIKISPQNYCRNICNYATVYKNDYEKHILTKKHIRKTYTNTDYVLNTKTTEDPLPIDINKKSFIEIIKDSKEFKELIMEQTNEFKKILVEQHSKIIQLEQINNTQIVNNHIINNNTFNLQFFLNEQCKDAINMIDFINSLQFSPTSVEYTGRNGYVQGITKLIMDGLKELDIYKRPIHCTDLKRETLYIKENTIWEKDSDEKQIFQKAIREVVRKNMQQIRNWRTLNPRCEIMETVEYEFHLVVMQQCIGGGTGHQEPNNKKIIKNIAKYVFVDKNIM